VDIEISPGSILRSFSSEESESLAYQWLATFGGNGAPNTKAYMWHGLSSQAYPSLSLLEASSQYELQVAPSFVVLSNDRDQAVETDQRPTSCSESDFLVFPPNMAWTMAFTHEDGWLGPYFAKHAQYDKLNQENLRKVEKARAIEQARQKGWL
jgi:hypothetical protein